MHVSIFASCCWCSCNIIKHVFFSFSGKKKLLQGINAYVGLNNTSRKYLRFIQHNDYVICEWKRRTKRWNTESFENFVWTKKVVNKDRETIWCYEICIRLNAWAEIFNWVIINIIRDTFFATFSTQPQPILFWTAILIRSKSILRISILLSKRKFSLPKPSKTVFRKVKKVFEAPCQPYL